MTDTQHDHTNDMLKDDETSARNLTKIQMIDSTGAVILGILALILLIALLRSQARNRAIALESCHPPDAA